MRLKISPQLPQLMIPSKLLPNNFGLLTLNHFGISVQDLDRSIAFYRALTGQDPTATGTWSSTGLDRAAGIGNSRSMRATIRWATFRINNVNIDLLQVKKEKESSILCFESET
jgi:hypothetical protein